VSDPTESEQTTSGKLRHDVLRDSLELISEPEGEEIIKRLPEDQQEGVAWALDYIALKAPMADYPLVLEKRMSFTGPDFNPIEGTPDVVCGNVVFDLKWRIKDYKAQMAAYALMVMETGWESVTVHVLYAEPKRAEQIEFTRESAEQTIFPIIENAARPDSKPKVCDFCGWCANRVTCPAVLEQVNAVIINRDDFNLETWHASDIKSGEEMGKALRVARVVADWCESVEYHAKEMVQKRGIVPTGFKIQTKQGNRFVTSIPDAFSKTGLPQDRFLAACEIKLSRLVEAYAEHNKIKKSPAEREIEAKLGETIQRKSPSISLIADK
jgi:CRISPR/Cas system-associated exonuclease Cas4 (RecB family)